MCMINRYLYKSSNGVSDIDYNTTKPMIAEEQSIEAQFRTGFDRNLNRVKSLLCLVIAFSLLCLWNKAQAQTEGVFVKKQPLGNQFNARSNAGMVATETDLYIYGGYTGANHQDFARYNLETGTLTKLEQMNISTNQKGEATFKVGDFMYHFDAYGTGVTRYNLLDNVWERVGSLPSTNPINPKRGFVIGSTIYLIGDNPSYSYFYAFDTETLTFTQKADSPVSDKMGTFAFSINGKGYAGGGRSYGMSNCSFGNVGCFHNSFYEYDPEADIWTQKANIPTAVVGAVAVAVNGKGYVGLGSRSNATYPDVCSVLWHEYDPETDTWAARQNFMNLEDAVSSYSGYFSAVTEASAVAVGTDIYVFGGHIKLYGNSVSLSKDDLRKYNTLTDTWATISTELGGNRKEALGVFLDGKVYAGGGSDGEPTQDFHEYDPATDTWTQKADIPLPYTTRIASATAGGKAYFVGGYAPNLLNSSNIISSKIHEYDPVTNVWTEKASYPGGARYSMIAQGYNGEIYAGFGFNGSGGYAMNFYKYTPAANTWTPLAVPAYQGSISSGFHASSFVIGDYLYVLNHDHYTSPDAFQRYSFADDTWSVVSHSLNGVPYTHAYINNAFAYNGKGYFIADQSSGSMKKLMEFDPVTNTFTDAGNIPFYSSNQTKIVADDGVYFAFGQTISGEDIVAGFTSSNQLWKWVPNPAISTQAGIYSNQNNSASCGFSLSQNQHQLISDNDGAIFLKVQAGSYQSNICIEVNSISEDYRETTGNFGDGEAVALFANKSFLVKGGELMPQTAVRLYFTNDELSGFVNAFNTAYNETATIDDIKIVNHYNSQDQASADHDPLNNVFMNPSNPTASFYRISTPVMGDYSNGKYFEVVSTNDNRLNREVYVVVFTKKPLIITSFHESTASFIENKISLYPNPTNSVLNVEAKENTNIKIVNMLGAAVVTQKLSEGNNSINVSNLTNGVYFISNDKGGVAKFVKE